LEDYNLIAKLYDVNPKMTKNGQQLYVINNMLTYLVYIFICIFKITPYSKIQSWHYFPNETTLSGWIVQNYIEVFNVYTSLSVPTPEQDLRSDLADSLALIIGI
jgi:uncharacterized BrkB/YihY/UPF0761 family membrane protein